MKIFFLTRTFSNKIKLGGGLIREKTVDILRKENFDVIVVTPNYNKNNIEIFDNIIYIPLVYNTKVANIFQRLGIYEDYLDIWVRDSFYYLKNIISKEDIIFATSGGELGCVKLGSLLKKEINCKLVIHSHDPIIYSFVNGLRYDSRFHVSREKQEIKYLQNADLIITSSYVNQSSLQIKYPYLKEKIKNCYFGYIKKINLKNKIPSKKLRIAYGGFFGRAQSPEILAKVAQGIVNIDIFFLGEYAKYGPLKPFLNKYNFIPCLSYDDYLEFMIRNIDVGFVSLSNDYLGACVPSKIYEYINLGIPILGALPEGDAFNIINNHYGIVCKYNDFTDLKISIEQLKNKKIYQKFKLNILKDKDSWSIDKFMEKVVKWLELII